MRGLLLLDDYTWLGVKLHECIVLKKLSIWAVGNRQEAYVSVPSCTEPVCVLSVP